MATQAQINSIIISGQAYLYAVVMQLKAELYGDQRELQPFIDEWAAETTRQIEELDGQTDSHS